MPLKKLSVIGRSGPGVNPKLAYFTHTCVRGFVATPPLYSDVHHRLCLHFVLLAIS